MTAAMHGEVKQVFISGITIFIMLVLICYVLFFIILKKIEITDKNLKSVYRSLVLISLSIVLGFGASATVTFVSAALLIDVNDLSVTLLAGIFINLSMSSNFFIYYIVSEQYRESFDRYLHIGMLKKIVGKQKLVDTLPLHLIATTTSKRNFAWKST
ncbi:hypothetical protein OESDEN_09223 [Oesophagostomum dentatum]|uniref:G-protein coupled receptors family 1 profile domain-containing protein n=1 Tax=Oesophagostomum dentatum TaxID=61180 RepID=A0A0B1T689_OESDE|nr:hypothetical protein OESDEN_09223 [Oesophagostomum dentatum]